MNCIQLNVDRPTAEAGLGHLVEKILITTEWLLCGIKSRCKVNTKLRKNADRKIWGLELEGLVGMLNTFAKFCFFHELVANPYQE